MKVTKQETLYHEYHGAILKHKCGKRIVTFSLLSFSLIFLFGLLWPLFFVNEMVESCTEIYLGIAMEMP